MPNISRTKTWNANETLTAADLNAEFDGLLNGINDNALDNDNLSQTDDYLFGSLILGSGISAGGGDGKLHVHVASAGTITAHADANDVTIENSTNTGLTIFSGTTGTGNIHFGDSGDNDIGKISYDHNVNDLIFTANAAEIFRYDQSDDQVEFSKPPTPVSDDGVALGASGTGWSDLFLASGGVINWNAGDVTLTHASNALTMAGGDLFLSDAAAQLTVGHTTAMVSGLALISAASNQTNNYVGFANYNTTNGSQMGIILSKSASATVGTNAETASGESLGYLAAQGVNASSGVRSAAQISFEQDAAAGATAVPGRILLSTETSGGTLTEALRIDSGQKIYNRVDSTGYYTGASDDFHWHHNGTDNIIEGASNLRLQTDGVLVIENDGASAGVLTLIGDTANANMTVGLTINQGANDNNLLEGKSSDIAHGLTSGGFGAAETDSFFYLKKRDATTGGLGFGVFAEDAANTVPLQFAVHGGTANTAKTTAANGLVEFLIAEHDGANALANITADGNVFNIRARVGGSNLSRFLIDEDGDMYTVTAGTTFDSHDDIAMISAYDAVTAPDQIIRTEYEDFATYNEEALVKAGVLGAPVAEGGMTNVTQLQRLHNGAIRQLGRKQAELVALLDERDSKIAALESEITKIKGMLN